MKARRLVDSIFEGEEQHPELGAFKGLFSVPVNDETADLMANIGQWIKYRNYGEPKTLHLNGTISLLPFKIMHLQRTFNGSLAYRVENQLDRFGRPVRPTECEIISEDEARKLWDANRKDGLEFEPDFDQG